MLADDIFPSKNSKKEQLRRWLTRNGYPWREDMLKSELLELCTRLAPTPEYRLDKLAAMHGVSILRTPPYHPELQPIETCWAVVKNDMANNCDFTMTGLRDRLPEAFAKVTANTCKEIISKVNEQEKSIGPKMRCWMKYMLKMLKRITPGAVILRTRARSRT